MPRSKSGLIRQAIGLRKGRLMKLIESSVTLIDGVTLIPADDTAAKQKATIEIDDSISKLKTVVGSLDDHNKQWQLMIEGLADDEDVMNEEQIYGEFIAKEDNFIDAMDNGNERIALMTAYLRRLDRAMEQIQHTDEPKGIPATTGGHGRAATAKLPKLTLPVFEGDYLLWSQFWALFKANVDEASDLHGVEKLSYLRGQLRGAALTAIDGVEITDDGYKIAVDILKQRFERTADRVIGSLYSQLKRMTPSSSRVADLQKTFDCCERIFRQLKSEGEDVDGNRSLIMDIMSKYPGDVLKEISRRRGVGTHSTVVELQAAFREFIDESSCIQGILGDLHPFGKTSISNNFPSHRSDNSKPLSKTMNNGGWSHGQTETSAFTTVDTADNKSSASEPLVPSKPCYFCDGNHFNSQCERYPTAHLRAKRLETVHRCCRCMSSKHSTAECRTGSKRMRCFFCKTGTHPSPLCPDKFRAPTPGPSKTANIAVSPPKPGDVPVSFTRSSVTSLCTEEQSLLSTATTEIVHTEANIRRPVRVIFDSGSHRSYVTESLAREMLLHHNQPGAEMVHVAVFGTERTLSMSSNPVQFQMLLRNGNTMTINAHTTPLVTNSRLLPGKLPEGTQRMMESMGSAMADYYNSDQQPPEVLIGTDYFWEFMIGSRLKTEDGIYLIPTSLGIILGGRYSGESDPNQKIPALLCLTERTSPSQTDISLCAVASESKAVHDYPDVDEYWSLEKIGISDDPIEDDDTLAMAQFNQTIFYKGGRYHVGLPWKNNKHQLPTNRMLARGRLISSKTAGNYEWLGPQGIRRRHRPTTFSWDSGEGSARRDPQFDEHNPLPPPSPRCSSGKQHYEYPDRIRRFGEV